jgi:UPF0716 family protein affecting phage T7 exclusion
MLRKLLLAVILVLLLELAALVWLTRHIGVLPTLCITALGTLVGASLAKRQGGRVFRDWQAALASGQPPAAGALDAMLVVASGVLFALPGLLTDVLGAILLLPPARRLGARYLRRWLGQHAGALPNPLGARQGYPRAGRDREVVDTEGEAVSDNEAHPSEPPRLPRERLH